MVLKLNINSIGVVAASFLVLSCGSNDVEGMKKEPTHDLPKPHDAGKLESQMAEVKNLSREAGRLAGRIVREVKKNGETTVSLTQDIEIFSQKLRDKGLLVEDLFATNVYVLDLLNLFIIAHHRQNPTPDMRAYLMERFMYLINIMSAHYEENKRKKAKKKKADRYADDDDNDDDDDSSSFNDNDDDNGNKDGRPIPHPNKYRRRFNKNPNNADNYAEKQGDKHQLRRKK